MKPRKTSFRGHSFAALALNARVDIYTVSADPIWPSLHTFIGELEEQAHWTIDLHAAPGVLWALG